MYLLSFFFAFLSAIELDSLQILYTFWELFASTENLGYWHTFWSCQACIKSWNASVKWIVKKVYAQITTSYYLKQKLEFFVAYGSRKNEEK